MAETASRLPEEDKPDISPEGLRARENASSSTGGGSSYSFNRGGSSSSAGRSSGGATNSTAASDGGATDSAKRDDGFYNPNELKDKEESPDDEDDDRVGKGFNPSSSSTSKRKARFQITRRRAALGVTGIAALGAIVGSSFTGIGFLRLPHFMANVEKAAFGRYQVDMRGRSSKWLQAYMELRFAEIDDPTLAPEDRDNLYFRSNRVDTNRPLKDWYRTMRASKFEQDLFERRGIKFTSVARKQGNQIVQRQALLRFDADKEVRFGLSQNAFDAAANGDVSAFNGKLRSFVEEELFENEKDTRSALKSIIKEEYPGWWRGVKRWHLRQDIQNMIGVRKWSFFEQTRQSAAEKKISIRNKIVVRALPEDSKSGKFLQCLFGITGCNGTTDPSNPDARAYGPNGVPRPGDKTGDQDNNPNTAPTPAGDGSGEANLQAGADGAAGDGIRKAIISKAFGAAGIASMLDSLARFSQSLKDHSLSEFVVNAKTAQAVGASTVFLVANDQLKTGEQTSEEVNQFMQAFKHPANNEGWSTVIDPSAGNGTVSAASTNYVQAKGKKEFCSEAHQEAMAKPENKEAADKEYQYLCPQNQIGNAKNVKEFEDSWNNGPGAILNPLLQAYHSVAGGIIGAFSSVTGAVSDAALSAVGLADDVAQVTAYAAEKAMEFGGAVLDVDDNTPSGQVSQIVLQGMGATAEASMRAQGAASTTPETASLATKNYLAYQLEEQNVGFSERYLSLDNPRSFASKQIASLGGFSFDGLGESLLHVFSSAISSPLTSLTARSGAANGDGYAVARFAGIDTFDLPQECIDAKTIDAAPLSMTNADNLGIFTEAELTWDLLTSKNAWYDALYAKPGINEKIAKTVWNCALFDNAARGGLGAPYGYKGEGAYGQ